mmetsp:Transcript_16506/g.51642  ORF Transcript_16506/g.51642 Transcript_16506/m.51642 type:complete len:207 (-) Transcript_16506:8-628(-)
MTRPLPSTRVSTGDKATESARQGALVMSSASFAGSWDSGRDSGRTIEKDRGGESDRCTRRRCTDDGTAADDDDGLDETSNDDDAVGRCVAIDEVTDSSLGQPTCIQPRRSPSSLSTFSKKSSMSTDDDAAGGAVEGGAAGDVMSACFLSVGGVAVGADQKWVRGVSTRETSRRVTRTPSDEGTALQDEGTSLPPNESLLTLPSVPQ